MARWMPFDSAWSGNDYPREMRIDVSRVIATWLEFIGDEVTVMETDTGRLFFAHGDHRDSITSKPENYTVASFPRTGIN